MNFEAYDFSAAGLYHERLCLDFVNSTGQHDDPAADHLRSYADLLAWCLDVELLTPAEADALYAQSQVRPAEAAAVFAHALELREAVFAVLSSAAIQQPPSAAALATFNQSLGEARGHMRLTTDEAAAHWTWDYDSNDLAQMLGPVAWSAVEVLQSADRADLRVCEGQDCDWMFLDTSRNHSRRWCSMQSCGNRAKAKRHYHRGRAASE